MFCPNCGKGDQKENTYCRQCGEFLPDLTKNALKRFGGVTPQQNANIISSLSLFASIVSLLAGLWMYATNFNVPIVLYLGTALLICNAIWHVSNFYTIKKLSKRLNPTDENLSKYLEDKTATQKELNEPDFSDAVPMSVTEKTTRKLKV
ncbi:hypothetical protein BH20ACI1_BH20ACI1_22150 [soil metagenome]